MLFPPIMNKKNPALINPTENYFGDYVDVNHCFLVMNEFWSDNSDDEKLVAAAQTPRGKKTDDQKSKAKTSDKEKDKEKKKKHSNKSFKNKVNVAPVFKEDEQQKEKE